MSIIVVMIKNKWNISIISLNQSKHQKSMLPKTQTTRQNRNITASKIHLKNINFDKNRNSNGMIGQRYSRTIDHLIQQVNDKTQELPLPQTSNITINGKEQFLEQQINDLHKQEGNLKHQMIRISEMAKNYKQLKIEAETKYQNLSKEFVLSKTQISSLESKIELLIQFNACLITITENSLEVFPQYQQHCHSLIGSIFKVKEELRQTNLQEGLTTFSSLQTTLKKIENFNRNVNILQTYKKKLIGSISQIHQSTKSIEERIAMIEAIDLCKLKQSISNLSRTTQLSETHKGDQSISFKLHISPQQINYKIIADSTNRFPHILSSISTLFEQHIHLVQSQKMQFQFAKNKKLIASQKYQCEICQKYQKIVNQIFTISRKAYKEIKFQFLKEIQGIEDIKQISLLI